ncbi:cation diffusion facilitator family transporter [Azospirillum thermophilum]|uniref:Cation transporter n=1 Tax=Azospirillum thermophilum TaxID=2202148 RepID=A0A2S2CR88_9PROT|nr:cation diffusion facilitator family transporter [Azospirillum thermophilum]AWK86935.1 cation transporter [Azospirillum thermophilum]
MPLSPDPGHDSHKHDGHKHGHDAHGHAQADGAQAGHGHTGRSQEGRGHGGHFHGNQSHAGHSHGGHSHGGHSHGPVSYDRAFAIGAVLNIGFVAVEAVYGFLANSTALLADAGHNLSDVTGLLFAWGAAWIGRRIPAGRYTYGFGSVSILVSLLNAVILLIAVGAITMESVRRFVEPEPVAEGTVIVVAAIGIVINGLTAWLFMGGQHDLNVKGAYLHMAADAAVSLGVVIAAILVGLTGWLWIDPLTGLAIAAVITVGTWGLLRDSIRLALAAVPESVDRAGVETYLADLPGVTAVHDLHIWPLSTTEVALTAHLVRPGAGPDDDLLKEVAQTLKERFGIGHATLQVEHDGAFCRLAPSNVV